MRHPHACRDGLHRQMQLGPTPQGRRVTSPAAHVSIVVNPRVPALSLRGSGSAAQPERRGAASSLLVNADVFIVVSSAHEVQGSWPASGGWYVEVVSTNATSRLCV